MKRFIDGEDRNQSTLLPEAQDDYIAEDNPVRVIDVFVDDLTLASWASLGLSRRTLAGPPITLDAAEALRLRTPQSCAVQ